MTHHDTDEFCEARFTHADLSGVRFRDCDLTGLRIIDCIIGDGVISGDLERLVVNDVDVTGFVQTELDRVGLELFGDAVGQGLDLGVQGP